MTDSSWRGLEYWERVRRAREDAGFAKAQDAATALNMKGGTYRAYERPPDASKHIKLDHNAAVLFGRRFGVRWEWLLTGEGEPKDDPEEKAKVEAFLAGLRAGR
jgi:transcriptional regulator with XRE-family HTH domain